VIWLVALFWLCCAGAGWAESEGLEYKVKGAYLFQFAQHVRWPAPQPGAAAAPLVIGVVGAEESLPILERTLRDKAVRGRKIVVRPVGAQDDPRQCQMLYVGASAQAQASSLLARLAAAPVLTVGEFSGFARQGGMVSLVLAEEYVRYDMNLAAARQAGLAFDGEMVSKGHALTELDLEQALLYEKKIGFLLSLPQHVDWPGEAFSSPEAPFVLGIVGGNPFGDRLSQAAADQRVQGRRIEVRVLGAGASAEGCHLVFFSQTLAEEALARLATLGRDGVLTVGQSYGFAERGGMINLVVADGVLRLEINEPAAARAGLRLRANLLRLKLTRLVAAGGRGAQP